ncbi:unnamed protein product [Brassicogethes aeneus]|uniref:Uncharacterized protein n=1 Tax=Brassicogethes aeneus TaxID=1431903 RepID=A0A9P0FEG4_BRAAE|nr:unnamed protein product [Brassicogethes aeneus]
MSDILGEGEERPLKGEGSPPPDDTSPVTFLPEVVIKEKKLTFEEASKCLGVLGKDESGIRYAYLMINVSGKKLTDVSVILNFKHILFLDVSINYLTLESLQVLVDMPFVILIKAANNKIESAALGMMPYLQVLVLSKNQITETCDINQPLLDTLDLNHNLICTAQFDVERLEGLKILELRGNHLLDFAGNYPLKLEKLYMANNKITKINIDDLSKLKSLEVLHLRNNFIRKLDGFKTQSLNYLNYLNLRNNHINKMRQFRKLQYLKHLNTLIILGNPVWGEDELIKGEDKRGGGGGDDDDEDEAMGEEDEKVKIDPRRIALLVLLPELKRINKEFVTIDEQELALKVKKEKYEEIMDEENKGNATVAMDTSDYNTKELLQDQAYQPITTDPTTYLEKTTRNKRVPLPKTSKDNSYPGRNHLDVQNSMVFQKYINKKQS